MERLSVLLTHVGDQQPWILPATMVAEVLEQAELTYMQGRAYLAWQQKYLNILAIKKLPLKYQEQQLFLILKTLSNPVEKFWALEIQALPEWISVSADMLKQVQVTGYQQAHHKIWLSINGKMAVIPDFDFIEKSLLNIER